MSDASLPPGFFDDIGCDGESARRGLTVSEMLRRGQWSDVDFGYHRDYDFYCERRNIEAGDGRVLYCVSEFNSLAEYAVHFCVRAQEIWAVSLKSLRAEFEFGESLVSYVPRKKPAPVTARGYLVPCGMLEEFGHCWSMPAEVIRAFAKASDKADSGKVGERAFEWLVNSQNFFRAIFPAPTAKASRKDDRENGIDFWVAGKSVQVKVDGPGGRKGTGNLFFQTHTMSVRDCESWHNFAMPAG